jgi:pyruvate,orthophosphate dikinase
MTFGFSRDDVAGFLPHYVEIGLILSVDPFDTLDEPGVGRLVQLAKRRRPRNAPGHQARHLRRARRRPRSIAFCHKIGLNYVSCSPFRVPTARLGRPELRIHLTLIDGFGLALLLRRLRAWIRTGA